MAGARAGIAGLGLVLMSGCASAAPPEELSGLWSTNAAACEAGVGVEFGVNAIDAVYGDERHTLFAHPRYRVEEEGEHFQVRITYQLPRLAGGAHTVGAYGVVVLQRTPDGGVAPHTHNLVDGFTGAARMRIADDPAMTALTLAPCDAHPWRDRLRGLSA